MTDPQLSASQGNILIVDDTPENLRLLSSMLIQQGYRVRSAINGSAALMAANAAPPDIILLDINMPEMDGFVVCERLKADPKTSEIPVVFLSAYSEPLDKVKAFQVGGADYITKPFHVKEVMARISNQLRLRRIQLDLQQSQAEALRLLAQEQELNRLKSEFVSMISHDFRTPLASIQGYAGLLQCGGHVLTLKQQNLYLNKINAAVEQVLFLLDKVLLLGTSEAGKIQCQPEPLNLPEFCQDLTEMLQLNANDQQYICFSCSGDCSGAEMDETLLRQILTNLISNAIKYSPLGGTIAFDLNCQEGLATFRIQDHGIGIPKDNLPHLFESFYRGNNVGRIRGTGLGLSVVKTCVEAHGGTIQLESHPGVGTTVIVRLPLI